MSAIKCPICGKTYPDEQTSTINYKGENVVVCRICKARKWQEDFEKNFLNPGRRPKSNNN